MAAHHRTQGRAANDGEWAGIVARRAADTYVIGVASTGIVCRPGCPARTPLRRNVRLFDDRAAAEAAGFRACKRCW